MTQKSKKQIEYTLATHAVERLTPSKEAIRLCELISDGKMSADRAVDTLLSQYGLKRVSGNG